MRNLPLPPSALSAWDLPEGWEEFVSIQLSGGDCCHGKGPVALAYQTTIGGDWTFSVFTEWLPVRMRRSADPLSFVQLAEFKQALKMQMAACPA